MLLLVLEVVAFPQITALGAVFVGGNEYAQILLFPELVVKKNPELVKTVK